MVVGTAAYLLHVVADLGRRGGVVVLLEELLYNARLVDAGFLLERSTAAGRKREKELTPRVTVKNIASLPG